MKSSFLLLIILGFSMPQSVLAAITISEVAWMGSPSSANHEWIELHNTGDGTDVTGWTLSDGMNLNITLTGTISAGDYVVLERTSDESAESNAFLIYTGALVNTGATLVLKRADNSIEDQTAGGENWENIGGDNTTKETAQYSTNGWVTAVATPGKVNASVSSTPEETEATQKSSSTGSPALMKPSSREPVKKLIEKESDLTVTITAPSVGYVNQPIEFSAAASGLGNTITNSLTYEWNFGDLGTSSKKETKHTFAYPGTYMVMTEASFGKHNAVASHEITVLPVAVSITRNTYGDIQINNDARYDIDLSKYRLEGKSSVIFPANTILLSGQTITVPYVKTGGINLPVSLYDASGAHVVQHSLALSPLRILEEEELLIKTETVAPLVVIPQSNQSDKNFGFVSSSTPIEVTKNEQDRPLPTTTSLESSREPKQPIWPYIALVSLIIVGIGSVILQPKAGKGS